MSASKLIHLAVMFLLLSCQGCVSSKVGGGASVHPEPTRQRHADKLDDDSSNTSQTGQLNAAIQDVTGIEINEALPFGALFLIIAVMAMQTCAALIIGLLSHLRERMRIKNSHAQAIAMEARHQVLGGPLA